MLGFSFLITKESGLRIDFRRYHAIAITSRDYKFFKYARNMADMSDYHRTPMGCVVVYGNKVIGYGCNSNKTHPVQMKYNQYRNFNNIDAVIHKSHAEVSALSPIRNLEIDWGKVSIYVYRKRKDKDFGLAKPCSACWNFLKDCGIKNIYYTGDDSYIYERLC